LAKGAGKELKFAIMNHYIYCIISNLTAHSFRTLTYFGFLFLGSCSLQKKIGKLANNHLINNPLFQPAHIGISIYEPLSNTYWYNHQSEKKFLPASNTKLFTCYAAMKYLADSLPGIRYQVINNELQLLPTGDPTLLHSDYPHQPVIQFLKKFPGNIVISDNAWQEEGLGNGWAWNDYNFYYMVEKSALPVYGNCIKFVQTRFNGKEENEENLLQTSVYTDPEINWKVNFSADTNRFYVQRKRDENVFTIEQGKEKYKEQIVPFVTNGMTAALQLLKDTIGKEISFSSAPFTKQKIITIYSQPTDSLLKPMMHNSDNFFAEQILLMASNEFLGVMNSKKIIDTLLRTYLKDLPQQPAWADGSGLSRYNLFTPKSFVWLLKKMKEEFDWKRITTIFPTGNEGTLVNYYQADSGFIYSKTGTLTGQVALSGYLITRKNKTLLFSILVNNHQSSPTAIRKSMERFLQRIRNSY
jgi:serine-type D-Ala-D-Ala carboxypeptidase/endopeptidase (penicillin-binding protein 4)